MGFQALAVWQLAQGVERGPWGLVTFALGAMPTLIEELELELLEEEDELLLPEELELELLPDLPEGLALEPVAALALRKTWLPGRSKAMLPSMGARPKAIVISQRVRSMFSPC